MPLTSEEKTKLTEGLVGAFAQAEELRNNPNAIAIVFDHDSERGKRLLDAISAGQVEPMWSTGANWIPGLSVVFVDKAELEALALRAAWHDVMKFCSAWRPGNPAKAICINRGHHPLSRDIPQDRTSFDFGPNRSVR